LIDDSVLFLVEDATQIDGYFAHLHLGALGFDVEQEQSNLALIKAGDLVDLYTEVLDFDLAVEHSHILLEFRCSLEELFFSICVKSRIPTVREAWQRVATRLLTASSFISITLRRYCWVLGFIMDIRNY
jgi:hypothetical protein